MSKLRTSVDAFMKSEGVHARLDHLTAMEINNIRPLLPHALDQILRMQSVSLYFKIEDYLYILSFFISNYFVYRRIQGKGIPNIVEASDKSNIKLFILMYLCYMRY